MARREYIQAGSPKLIAFFVMLPTNIKKALTVLSEQWKRETQANLAGSTTGKYPARRTGRLQSAVNPTGPHVYQVSDKVYRADLTVETPYAHIQNYGGTAGRYHTSIIPPRPYASDAAEKVWSDVLKTAGDIIFAPLRA